MTGQGLTGLGQGLEHPFTTGDISLIDVRGNRVDPQRIERMPFRGHQVPATVAFLRAEETAGLEGRTVGPTSEFIQGRLLTFRQPGFQLLLFLGRGAFELLIAADLFRPFGPGRLTVGIHQGAIHGLGHGLGVLNAEALKQNALGHFRLIHRHAHCHHLAAIQLTSAAGQQDALTVDRHRHGRPGLHAQAQRRCRLQRHQQGLRRAGRQIDTADQRLAIVALDGHVQGQRPIHGVLHPQAHETRLRPVPGPCLRGQPQGRTSDRVERHPPQHFTFGGLLGVGLRQVGVLSGHLDHIGGAHKVEQRLLGGGCRQQGRCKQQGKNGR